MKRLLEDAGYSVSLAVDGEDAWEMCQKNLPDLVLSDVMMPKLNGFEFLKKVRSAEYTYSLPIILISARAGEVDKAEGLVSGADDYLSKPFHSGELIARVEGAVKLGKYRKKAHEQLLNSTNHIAKIGGWSFDVDTLSGEWTEELIRIHDLPPGAQIDVNKGLDFYTPQSRPIIEKAVQDAITLGKPYDLQLEIISAAGVHKWVRTVGEAVILEGKVVKVQGVLQDITELKRSEIESQRNLKKYQNLFENSLDALMTFSPATGKFTKANKATIELFGAATEEEFLAVGPANVSPPFQPDGRPSDEKAVEMIAIALRDGSNFLEWTHKRLNGDNFYAEVQLTRVTIEGEEPFVQATVRDITERKHTEEKVTTYLKQLKGAMNGTLLAVSKMIEQRDPYTSGHEQRVGIIAADIACEMGYSAEQCEVLQEIGLVHDIGKISIPSEILTKPTKLSPLEYELIKAHPEKGYEILKNIEFPFPIAEIIYQHHERIDGSGYPRGLKGDEILWEARILAVADVIEAMASHRPYRAGLGIHQALEEIEQGRGISYDSDVVDACLRLFREKNYSIPMQH